MGKQKKAVIFAYIVKYIDMCAALNSDIAVIGIVWVAGADFKKVNLKFVDLIDNS